MAKRAVRMARAMGRVKRGETFREAARAERVTLSSLHTMVTEAGIAVRGPGAQPKPYVKNIDKAVRLVRSGLTYRAASAETGVSVTTIHKWNKRGLPA